MTALAPAAPVERTASGIPVPSGFLAAWGESGRSPRAAWEALAALRSEDEVMSAAVMRAMTPTALSFADSLVERMRRNRWRIACRRSSIDAAARGTLIYEIEAEGSTFHFGISSQPSAAGPGDGRLRENRFDFLGTLVDGPVDERYVARELEEARAHVWRGRSSSRTFGWTFANRGATSFDELLGQLACGRQPSPEALAAGSGYVVRNAGFYGNGRHATRAWASIPAGHPLSHPYHVDLFCLYLWRLASFDILDAAARARSAAAVPLGAEAKRMLGIGNSSGIGTVAALVRWPSSLSAFMFARELALAHAKARPGRAAPGEVERVRERLLRLADDHAAQPERGGGLEAPSAVAAGLREIADGLQDGERPWGAAAERATRVASREARELLNAELVGTQREIHDLLVGWIDATMRIPREIEPEMPVGELLEIVERRYGWALAIDFERPGAAEHFWYKSEENGENRRGVRAVDPGVANETFVDVAGAVQELHAALRSAPVAWTVGRFLLEQPTAAMAVSRVQLAARLPYSELRENVIDAAFRPCDAIRCFLSVLGIERPDPASVQWVRGVFFLGAPLPAELAEGSGEARR